MWQRAMNLGGGGSSSVKSGTFEVNASTAGTYEFDTELGNAVKRVVVIGEIPGASSGPFSIIGWDDAYAGYYKYMGIGAAGTGGTTAVGTSQNNAIYFNKQPNTNNGVVEMAWTATSAANKTGTYHWYAE